jgi:hypothetical protein
MTIWRLISNKESLYASFICTGSWNDDPNRCPKCGRQPKYERVAPLKVEWHPGEWPLGALTWDDTDIYVALTEEIANLLKNVAPTLRFGPVEMVPSRKRRRTPAPGDSARTSRTVTASELREVWIDQFVKIEEELSTVQCEEHCEGCGFTLNRIEGAESLSSRYDPALGQLRSVHTRRRRDHGIYVNHRQATEAGIFRVSAMPWWILCTDDVRNVLEDQQMSNIRFLDVGDTVDDDAT